MKKASPAKEATEKVYFNGVTPELLISVPSGRFPWGGR